LRGYLGLHDEWNDQHDCLAIANHAANGVDCELVDDTVVRSKMFGLMIR
jgi:hypothetical protein